MIAFTSISFPWKIPVFWICWNAWVSCCNWEWSLSALLHLPFPLSTGCTPKQYIDSFSYSLLLLQWTNLDLVLDWVELTQSCVWLLITGTGGFSGKLEGSLFNAPWGYLELFTNFFSELNTCKKCFTVISWSQALSHSMGVFFIVVLIFRVIGK